MVLLMRSFFAFMVDVLVTSASRYSYNRRISRILKSIVPDMKNLLVLDAGCGEGEYFRLFGGNTYIGIDIGDYNFKRSLIDGAHFCRARIEELPFRHGTFDLVFSSFMIEHVEDIAAALASIGDVLKARGAIFLSTGTKWARYTGEMHSLFWKASDDSIGQAHHYFDVGELTNIIRDAGYKGVSACYVGGPFATCIELVITFFRLLIMKLRGERYMHGRDSDEAESANEERNSGIAHFIWKLTVPLQFCIRLPLYEISYWMDLLLSPLRLSRFVVITANQVEK